MSALTPLIEFGVISDTQYSDHDDGFQFNEPDRVRRYRKVPEKLKNAADAFESLDLSFCVLLGDVIDGKSKNLGQTSKDYDDLCEVITKNSSKSWHFCVGNHDFYNFSRQEIYEKPWGYINPAFKADCSPSKLYYDFSPALGFRCVWLDPFEGMHMVYLCAVMFHACMFAYIWLCVV